MDDLQRNDVSTLLGDAINAIGSEGNEAKLNLNSGTVIEIPPNFYVIGTYNATETGAIAISGNLMSKFYVREILSDIEYITEDSETENAVYYDQVRSLVFNYLDMQYRLSTYDQNRYVLGHGYFSGDNVSLKIRYQLIPILKQYISEGILDRAAEESVLLLEASCIKKKTVQTKTPRKSCFSDYKNGMTVERFITEDSTKQCSSVPIENLVGRIIDQKLLTDEQIKNAILFNKKVCYREMEVGGVTYLARLYVTYSESRVNLGIHYYRNSLYSSNLVGICRIKSVDDETLYDAEGNELLIKVVPRFNVTVVELLNYIRDDDEFDRYMAPQTISNRHKEKDIEAIDRNEIFYFFENEKPLKVDDGISAENSIITVTVFLTLLRLLCRRPLMGRMLKEEENLTGKVKGKIVIEKNIRSNTMHGRNDRFYCQYLRFSDDIVENQILKAALKKAKRFIIDYFGDYSKDNNNYATMISYCSNALRHISEIECSGSACNGLKFSGCYTYYKPVMAMAKMVLDDISVESNGEISTTGYIVPYAISMEKLFEVYVRAYLKKNGIESYRSRSDTGIRLEKFDDKTDVFFEEEGLVNPGKYISGSIKPDLVLTDCESGETVVFDVKYKDYTNGDSRNDRLQLLAYSMMMNANNVGIILPAQTDVEIFDARRINSMEHRIVKYHQMLLGIMKDNPTIANYIKDNTFEKKE